MQYKIEKGIPIPNKSKTGLRGVLRELKVGDSFLGEPKDRVNAYISAKTIGITIQTSIKDQPSGKIRVWRVS